MLVSLCKCWMFVSDVHPVAILSAMFCRQCVPNRQLGTHCQCGQLRYRRHTEAESRSSIAGIGRSATKKGDLTSRESSEVLAADSVGGCPAAKRQLPFGSLLLVVLPWCAASLMILATCRT